MYEMKTLVASELLEYLNSNKGEVIYLEDTHNDWWTLVFRKSVIGRPPKLTLVTEDAGTPSEHQQYKEPTGFPEHEA